MLLVSMSHHVHNNQTNTNSELARIAHPFEGKILVYIGAHRTMDSEAEIAAFLAPVIASEVLRHNVEFNSHVVLSVLPSLPLIAFIGAAMVSRHTAMTGIPYFLGSGTLYRKMFRLSAKRENEADYFGLVFMARAGYDVTKAATMWESQFQTSRNALNQFIEGEGSASVIRKDPIKFQYVRGLTACMKRVSEVDHPLLIFAHYCRNNDIT
jgi:predicted Zn-dependent protease